jgi:hypothetical protein
VGFGLLNYHWAFSAGRFYRVPLPAARQTPNLEENQGFRAFQLSSQEAPSVWSDASEHSSGRWNYGREMAEKFYRKWRFPRHFCVLLHAVKHDMGQAALLPLRRKACWGFCRPKNPTTSAGFEPANLGTKGQHATSRPPKPRLFVLFLVKYFPHGKIHPIETADAIRSISRHALISFYDELFLKILVRYNLRFFKITLLLWISQATIFFVIQSVAYLESDTHIHTWWQYTRVLQYSPKKRNAHICHPRKIKFSWIILTCLSFLYSCHVIHFKKSLFLNS